MKLLVCTDGSEHSKKILGKAAEIAEGCNVDEVAIIHVYEEKYLPKQPYREGFFPTEEDVERLNKMAEENKKDSKVMLQEALDYFKDRQINARKIFKEGHPADTIVNTVTEEGFDMILIGSRGLRGLEKVFLGSVSSAVVQEAKNCIVAVVK